MIYMEVFMNSYESLVYLDSKVSQKQCNKQIFHDLFCKIDFLL